MVSVQDIAEFIGDLETRPLSVLEERCLRVRNRNAECQACKDVCPEQEVIHLEPNALQLNFYACMGCTACTTICPTEALAPLAPTDAALAARIADVAAYVRNKSGQPEVVIACARIASKKQADPRTFAEVPCLCRIDESLLLDLAAHGVPWVDLVEGGCSTCRFRNTQHVTNRVVENINDILEYLHSAMRVERVNTFPSTCLIEDEKDVLGASRRNFFSFVRKDAANVTAEAAKHSLNLQEPTIPVLKRIQQKDGALPYFQALRHEKVLESIRSVIQQTSYASSSSTAESFIRVRHMGTILIDEEACNACGVCATFCPAAALVKQSRKDAKAQGADLLLDFSWDRCIGCGACADVCPKKCIEVHDSLDLSLLANPNTSRNYFLLKH